MNELQLASFFADLGTRLETLKEVRSAYDEQMAFDFNWTQMFLPDENKTSQILAFFLDPTQSHGQKDTFLRLFCMEFLDGCCNWDALISQKVSVRTEQRTQHGRRIDIVVAIGDDRDQFLIGIENKIWAQDQQGQLKDYAADLQVRAENRWRLLYLSPFGRDPSTNSINMDDLSVREHLQIISYDKHIIPLLDQFAMACKSDKVTTALRDYQDYLRRRFMGVKHMDESAAVKKFLMDGASDSSRIRVAFHIVNNIDIVKDSLWESTRKQLEQWANENGMKCHFLALGDARKQTWTKLLTFGGHEWSMSLEFHRVDLGSLVVTVEGQETGSVNATVLKEAMNKLPGTWLPNQRPLPGIHHYIVDYSGRWDTNAKPWLDMATKLEDGHSAFTRRIIKLYEILKDTLPARNKPEHNASC
jgi:hypothetical protein